MSTIKAIRERLQLTQAQLGEELGCTQGNVWQMETQGQEIKLRRAERLIEIAAQKGLHLTLDQVYGRAPLPPAPESSAQAA